MLQDTKSPRELPISWRCSNGLPQNMPLSKCLPKAFKVHLSLQYASSCATSAQGKGHYWFLWESIGLLLAEEDHCLTRSGVVGSGRAQRAPSRHHFRARAGTSASRRGVPQALCLSEHRCEDAVLQSVNVPDEALRRWLWKWRNLNFDLSPRLVSWAPDPYFNFSWQPDHLETLTFLFLLSLPCAPLTV